MRPRHRLHGLAWLILALLPGACGQTGTDAGAAQTGRLDGGGASIGLYSSLPILWPEQARIADYLQAQEKPHWALGLIRRYAAVQPLDTLADEHGDLPLPPGGLLILAQPFPLSPDENVALDDWVRRGGRVLLFADPMLTAHSIYPLGDRRRPQDVALLSPILSRWGLELQFDETQPVGEHAIALAGGAVPVNLAGRFVRMRPGGNCALEGEGLLADCEIGTGRVLALADAALLEDPMEGAIDSRRKMLASLVERLSEK